MMLDTGQDTMLLIEKSSHCLSYYDIASGERTASVAMPEFPHEFVADAKREFAYVAHYGIRTSADPSFGGTSILVVDIKKREIVHTIDCRPFNRLHGMAMDDEGRLYVLSEGTGTLLVFENPRTATSPTRATHVGGVKSHLFALTRDGRTALALNILSHTVTKLDPHDPIKAPTAVSPGRNPEGLCLSQDEKTLFVGNRGSNTISEIDVDSMTVRRSVQSRLDPTRIYDLRDNRLLVTHFSGRCMSVIDARSLQELAFLNLDAGVAAATIDALHDRFFVSIDRNAIIQFKLSTLEQERSFATQEEPDCALVV